MTCLQNVFVVILLTINTLLCQYNYLCDFSTKFSSNSAGTWSAQSGCNVTQTDPSANGAVTWLGGDTSTKSWTDYTIESTFRVTSSPSNNAWTGIIFRATSIGNYYNVALLTDDNRIYNSKFYNNNFQLLTTSSYIIINEDTDYTLRVQVSGNSWTIYLNDVQRHSGSDNSFSAGSIGLRCYFSAATFQTLYITLPTTAPTLTPISPLTPSPTNHPTQMPITPIPTMYPSTILPILTSPPIPTTAIPTTIMPTNAPNTNAPTTSKPTTSLPISTQPTKHTLAPTTETTQLPSLIPTTLPSMKPTQISTKNPSNNPTSPEPLKSTKIPTTMPTHGESVADETTTSDEIYTNYDEESNASTMSLWMIISICCITLILCIMGIVIISKCNQTEIPSKQVKLTKIKHSKASMNNFFEAVGNETPTINVQINAVEHGFVIDTAGAANNEDMEIVNVLHQTIGDDEIIDVINEAVGNSHNMNESVDDKQIIKNNVDDIINVKPTEYI